VLVMARGRIFNYLGNSDLQAELKYKDTFNVLRIAGQDSLFLQRADQLSS